MPCYTTSRREGPSRLAPTWYGGKTYDDYLSHENQQQSVPNLVGPNESFHCERGAPTLAQVKQNRSEETYLAWTTQRGLCTVGDYVTGQHNSFTTGCHSVAAPNQAARLIWCQPRHQTHGRHPTRHSASIRCMAIDMWCKMPLKVRRPF